MPPLTRPRGARAASTQVLTLNGVTNARKPLSRTNSGIDLTFTLKNGMSLQLISTLNVTAFGKESFRGCQREVIEAALEGSPQSDTVLKSRPRCVRPCANGDGQVIVLSTPGNGSKTRPHSRHFTSPRPYGKFPLSFANCSKIKSPIFGH